MSNRNTSQLADRTGRHASRVSSSASSPKTFFLFVAVLCAFLFSFAQAAETTVTANVSATNTTLDEPIRLTVTVTGARNANMPSHIDADGLDINYQSKSQRFELSSGFGATMSTVITYIVTPQKVGVYRIPAITVETGGQSFTTTPIAITVGKGAGGSGNNSDRDAKESSTPKIYAELLLPKDTAYVGEIIPVEVRFYFDNSVTFQLNPPGQVPQIDGEGFSKLRFPQARLEQKSVKGSDYRVLIYQTSLVAAKSGELSVGPAALNFVVGMPQKQRRRNPFDDPFSADPFNSLFFNNQRIEREMTVQTEPAKLRIKQLPSPRPPGFSGAVGQFTLQASAKPTQVKIGDPITYTTVVSGKGNFDLVAAPTLASTDGWRTYPPTGKLAANDEMGVSGDKSFEMAMIPERQANALPEASFVYFDPTQEKYITLQAPPISVQIEGQAIVKSTPSANNPAQTTASATPAAVASDLPPVKTALVGEIRSFAPLWQSRLFWALQTVPLLLLGALVWPKIAAALAPNLREARLASLRKERAALSTALRSADPAIFLPAATRQLQIDAELASQPHSTVADIISAANYSDDEAETVREIFARRDELAYGGGQIQKPSGRELSSETLRRYQGVLVSRTPSK